MHFEFDAAKDRVNTAKHGLSLALAAQLEWDDALVWVDDRRRYGEARHCALGLIGSRVHFVAYVDRGHRRRVISLRKANERESRHYAAHC